MSVLFPESIEAVDYTFVQDKMTIEKVAGVPYIIQADIQPSTGEDEGVSITNTGVGREEVGLVKVYSDTKLNVAKEGQSYTGTVLTWEGNKWEVIREFTYQKGSFFSLINHYKYLAQLLTEGELI